MALARKAGPRQEPQPQAAYATFDDERAAEPAGTAAFDASGDRADMPTWDELVREHADRVYRLAYRLSGNAQDAEDLTQETFIRVFRSLQSYEPGTFEGWLHRITTNLFLDMVRRRNRIRMEALPEDYERVPSSDPDPGQIYADANLGPQLQNALDALAPEFRAAVVLADIEGLSYEEVAATLGVKLGTVRSRIHRGRKSIREALANQGLTSSAALAYGARPRHRRELPSDSGRGTQECRYCGGRTAVRPSDRAEEGSGVEHLSGSFKRAFSRRPGEFSSTEHLAYEAVVAFVDGELRMNAHLRAGTHIAECAVCAAEVDAQRQVRTALRESGEITVPHHLLGQLAQIPTDCHGGRPPFDGFPTFTPESSRRNERDKRGRRRNAR